MQIHNIVQFYDQRTFTRMSIMLTLWEMALWIKDFASIYFKEFNFDL